MKQFSRFPTLFGGFALLVFATQAFGGPVCGPGPGWVGTCPGGLYAFNSTSNFSLWLDLNGNHTNDGNGGGDYVGFVQTTGTTDIYLAPGSGTQMLSEVYQLSETAGDGTSIIAGDGVPNGTADGTLFSPGAITERGFSPSFCDPVTRTPANPNLADSCYNVFFQLTIPTASLVLYNHAPLTVVCEGLTGVPPYGCQYKWNQQDVLLYDGPGLTGAVKGSLLPADLTHHTVTPEPASGLLLAGSLLALGALMRRRRSN